MAFTTEVTNLATRIGTEFKTVYSKQGNLASLTTTDKASLVAALNELQAEILAGGSITADGISDATVVGKAVIRATNAAAARSAIGAGTSSIIIGGGGADACAGNDPRLSDARTPLAHVHAWADITTGVPATFPPTIGSTATTAVAGNDARLTDARTPTAHTHTAANISDASTVGKSVLTAATSAAILTLLSAYSQAETNTAISTAVNNLISSAPGALDTLNELAAALGNDPNFATTINTALGNRVRVDAAQAFTAPQQLQARTNIDVYSKADIGTPTTDYVAVFNAALV